MKIVIIGYGPGGANAAIMARSFSPDAEVVIYTEEKVEAHRKPGASMALEFPETSDLLIGDWSYIALKKRKIEVKPDTSVIDGDLDTKQLTIRGPNGKESSISFDKLIIATGGIPSVPDMPGTDLEGVYTIQDMTDASVIGSNLSEMKSVVIVGAGFSGLETAERLYKLGIEVHIIIRSRIMRKQLEESMSQEILSRIPSGIHIHHGAAPNSVNGDGKVSSISVANKEIETDAVLFMTGVKPNTLLAKKFGLEIGPLGGIKVNQRMETSIEDVYAVGDCIEILDSLSSNPVYSPIGSVAARAGRQAGVAAIGKDIIYEDSDLRFQYDRIFSTDIICIGQSSTTAKEIGVQTKVEYIEDNADFTKVALILDSDDRLIGGQVIAARMGARIAYQILERMKEGATLREKPLLKSRHTRIKEQLELVLGPIE